MKKIAFLLFTLSCFVSQAQPTQLPPPTRYTVSFESQHGESFTVYIDGEQKNRMPQSRVMVNDVSNQTHEVVVVLKQPEQKAAFLRLLPGESVVTVYVDYDARLEQLSLYTPSYNLAEKNKMDYSELKKIAGGGEEVGDKEIGPQIPVAGVEDSTDGIRVVTSVELSAMQQRMKSLSFDSDRMELGKVLVASSSLTAEQIGKLVSVLDYSASQVELLKYAYGYCIDPQNYNKAIDILTFNSDKRKVMDFIATQ